MTHPLKQIIESASRGLVQRDVAVQLVVLAAVAGEHVLLIGPPGTAKSEAVRRIASGLGGRYFEYLIGRFTEPSEIFGPVDLQKLRQGVVETQTAGMLPEAEVAFLDEVFLGSSAILNTLLGVLNERRFRRGHTSLRCPLRVCVGASNALPEDPALAAFSDRFLLHLFLEPVPDPHLESLLEAGWALTPADPEAKADSTSQGQGLGLGQGGLRVLDEASAEARKVDVSPVRPRIAEVVRTLRSAGIPMSDRRVVKLQRLVAAAAVLDGRSEANPSDLWPVIFAIPEPGDQDRARELLRELLAPSDNTTVREAAESASMGPLARAGRLAEAAGVLFDQRPDPGALEDTRAWRLKLEGVAREIDASFPAEALPPALREVRPLLVEALRSEDRDRAVPA